MKLLVVESPTKARTLSRFLGSEFEVEATMGHIKDLPKSPISVDIEKDFKPDYILVPKQKETVNKLTKAAKKADLVILATDPDREGEAISAHVQEVLSEKGKGKFTRIVFHEITKEAVEEALRHAREVDRCLVDAQIARRVLDRLVGYKLSPLLWKKVRRGLSAGRVQSVAVRLIVEREREIEAFKPVEYWEIGAKLKKEKAPKKENFLASLFKYKGKKLEVDSAQKAKGIVKDLEKSAYKVEEVKKSEVKKSPYPPFTTSTMTQAGARVFGWSSKRTMAVAQRLYEEGMITYHRTDSLNLAGSAVEKARAFIAKEYGTRYLPEKPRFYKTSSKSAQEAHEAIRPTDVNAPKTVKTGKFAKDMEKLYALIWNRFVACQMADSVYDKTSIDISAGDYLLRVTGQTVKFDGWRKVSPLKTDTTDQMLPDVAKGEPLDLVKVVADQKFTQPPARYNEASLIKTLEKLGIGRPSTYAPTISVIQTRSYVEKDEGVFRPTPVGVAVTDFLVGNFEGVFDYGFTAEVENDLDRVADGKSKWVDEIREFWDPFSKKLESVEKKAKRVKIEAEKLGKKCPDCKDGELVIRTGRFGEFISCSRFPECKHTEKYEEKIKMKCPTCKVGDVIIKKTKRGRKFYGCSRYPECDWASWKNPIKEKKSDL